jgi:hypothetical protein
MPCSSVRLSAVLSLALLLTACGGGGGGSGSTPQGQGHSVSGNVTGAAGVIVTLSGKASATTATDAAGDYQFRDLADGSYTVTPSLTGYTFDPASAEVSLSGADASGVDFAGSVIAAPPRISDPQHVTVEEGAEAVFSVTASGDPAPTLAWERSPDGIAWTSIGGATATTYRFVTVLADTGARFRARATSNGKTATSAAATLTVTAALPRITTPPAPLTVVGGQQGCLWVRATGTGPLHFAWRHDGIDVPVDAPALCLPLARPADAGSYTVTVSNAAGAVTSPPATLRVDTTRRQSILLIGGRDATAAEVARVERYDLASNVWSTFPPLTSPRQEAAAVQLLDGRVLVIGGWSGMSAASSATLYDPRTATWTSAQDMRFGRLRHTATVLADGRVLVVGGSSVSLGAEIYDPAENTWSSTGDMTWHNRSGHTATLLRDGRVLVVGGFGSRGLALQPAAEVYDPVRNAWSPVRAITQHRMLHTATLLLNGRVLIAGGFDTADSGTVFPISADLYDPATDERTDAAPLTRERSAHGASIFPNGDVLVAGGSALDPASSATAELFSAGEWTGAGDLSRPCLDATAALLASGRVAVACSDPGRWTSVDLYDSFGGRTTGTINDLATDTRAHVVLLLNH